MNDHQIVDSSFTSIINAAIYQIDLPRPRVTAEIRYDPQFIDLSREIWNDLREEVQLGQSRGLQASH